MSGHRSFAFQDIYTPTFSKNYKKYGSIRERIDDCIEDILSDPYAGTEFLGHKAGFDLRGLRSARINRNFRIIFCIWEEYKNKSAKNPPLSPGSLLHGLLPHTVIFLTVGPHEKAYALK